MKSSNRAPRSRQLRSSAAHRARLLAAFARSGLSAAAFARQHQINYTTFCGWRHRQSNAKPAPDFVQVEISPAPTSSELVIELGVHARLRLHSADQLELAARLLQSLNTSR